MISRNGFRAVLLCAVSVMFIGGAANADLLVDTGQPSDVNSGATLGTSWIGQWLAGEFTLTEAYTITDVVGWMFELTAGEMTLAIYGDDGDLPDTTSALFSTTFVADLPGENVPGGTANAWVGGHGLDWDLGPGTYWAAFEVPTGEDTWFALPDDAPSPLAHYAFGAESGWTVPQWGDPDWGLRVYGSADGVVPEPATMTLLGLGLAGLAFRRRKQ